MSDRTLLSRIAFAVCKYDVSKWRPRLLTRTWRLLAQMSSRNSPNKGNMCKKPAVLVLFGFFFSIVSLSPKMLFDVDGPCKSSSARESGFFGDHERPTWSWMERSFCLEPRIRTCYRKAVRKRRIARVFPNRSCYVVENSSTVANTVAFITVVKKLQIRRCFYCYSSIQVLWYKTR